MLCIPSFISPFWAFNSTVGLVRHFWGLPFKCWLRMKWLQVLTSLTFWLFTQVPSRKKRFGSAHDSSSISETWFDSAHDSSGFPGIDSELTHNSSGFPSIDSDRLMIQNSSRFRFKSTHDSSKQHLILSRLSIRFCIRSPWLTPWVPTGPNGGFSGFLRHWDRIRGTFFTYRVRKKLWPFSAFPRANAAGT